MGNENILTPNELQRRIGNVSSTAWQVTALFLAANILLITFTKEKSLEIILLGLLTTFSTIYFNLAFRRKEHTFVSKYRELIESDEEEKLDEELHNEKIDQWLGYCIFFGGLGFYWFFQLKDYFFLVPFHRTFMILIYAAIILIIYVNGKYPLKFKQVKEK